MNEELDASIREIEEASNAAMLAACASLRVRLIQKTTEIVKLKRQVAELTVKVKELEGGADVPA